MRDDRAQLNNERAT